MRVMPQATYPDGKKSEWALYDHEYEYATKLRTRMWASQQDTGFLGYFLRPYQQRRRRSPGTEKGQPRRKR